MVQTILSRLATSLLVIFGASVLVYCIMYLLPGDPVLLMLDPSSATPEMIENLRVQLGLDQPFYIQFANYFGDMLRGDFGKSMINSDPVLPKILEHFPATLALTALSSIIAITIGITLGVLSAIHRNGVIDFVARLVGLFGISMPTFWTGISAHPVIFSTAWLVPGDGFRRIQLTGSSGSYAGSRGCRVYRTDGAEQHAGSHQ